MKRDKNVYFILHDDFIVLCQSCWIHLYIEFHHLKRLLCGQLPPYSVLHTAAKDNNTLKIRERLTVSIFFPALEYEDYWQEYFSKVTPIGIFGLENHKFIKWIAPISDVNIAEI